MLGRMRWIIFGVIYTIASLVPPPVWAISTPDKKSVLYDTVYYEDVVAPSLLCGSGSDTLQGHTLPASKGGSGYEQNFERYGLGVPANQNEDDYYITMRWRFRNWNWDGTSVEGPESSDFYLKHPKILVTNPRTKKSIIAVALESGPAPWTGVDGNSNNTPKQGWTNPQDGTPPEYKGRVSGFPPKAYQYLEYRQRTYDGEGDDLIYSWAPDQNARPGPTSQVAAGGSSTGCAGEANFIKHVVFEGQTIEPTAVVLHWTGGNSDSSVGGFVDAIRGNPACGAAGCSVQLFADGRGKTFQLTQPLNSYTEHATGINDKAIGIEIAGRGEEDLLKNEEQFKAVVAAVVFLCQKYNIPVEPNVEGKKGILGHFETDQASYGGKSGKSDPGAEYLEKVRSAVKEVLKSSE